MDSCDVAGRVGGAGMTQLAVSVILVCKCVLARRGGDEMRRGLPGWQGASKGQWAWSLVKVSSAGDPICSMESGDDALERGSGWIVGYQTILNRQTGRQLRY